MKVAVVGRTNVGKSSLFNILCGKHISITSEIEDTTVDYISYGFNNLTLYDTVGLHKVKDFNSLSGKKILESDLIFYILSVERIDNMDYEFLNFLNRKRKKIHIIWNKIDLGEPQTQLGYESFLLSCKTKEGVDKLFDFLNLEKSEKDKPVIGIIGRCNSGKSTLMNCILKKERSKTSEEIGTTRDSILEEGKFFNFLDTAGYRKENNFLEYTTSLRRSHALKQCSGIILLLDGSMNLTKIEKDLMKELKKYASFAVIAINKLDLLGDNHIFFDFLTPPVGIPSCYISSKNNILNNLFHLLSEGYKNSIKNIKTSDLNNWLLSESINLFSSRGKIRIRYMIHKSQNPHVFIYFSSHKLTTQSEKFLIKHIIDHFSLSNTVVNLKWSQKKNKYIK